MATISIADKFSTSEKKAELYSDFGIDLQAHPGKKDVLRYTNEAALKRSIINLLLTDYHERLFQPYIGANLKHMLFEPASEETLASIKNSIYTCLSKFEPRIRVTDIKLTLSPDEHYVYVSMTFAVINQITPTTINFILNRVR